MPPFAIEKSNVGAALTVKLPFPTEVSCSKPWKAALVSSVFPGIKSIVTEELPTPTPLNVMVARVPVPVKLPPPEEAWEYCRIPAVLSTVFTTLFGKIVPGAI